MISLGKQIGNRIISWLLSGIRGTASTLAGFDGGGDATEYTEANYLLKDGSRPIQPTVDSTTAWQMKDQAGNVDFNYDSTNGRIGIGTNAPQRTLHILGDGYRLERNDQPAIEITRTDNGMVAGSRIYTQFAYGKNSLNISKVFSQFSVRAQTVTSGNEKGRYYFENLDGGVNYTALLLDGKSTAAQYSLIGNASGGDNDSIIKGLNNDNLFYVDAGNDRVGIGTSIPGALFSIAEKFHIDSNGKVAEYNDIATEGYGQPVIVDDVALIAQSTSIGSTNFTNAGVAGTYRCNYYLEVTTLNAGATSIQFDVTFTDGAGATTVSSVVLPLTALGRTSGIFFVHLSSGSISYSTTLIDASGLARYALYCSVERLS